MGKFVSLLIFLACFLSCTVNAYHIIGGEIFYRHLGINPNNGAHRYRIIMKLYRDGDFVCGTRQGCLDYFENPVPFSIFTATGRRLGVPRLLTIAHTASIRDTLKNPCLAPQTIYLEVAFYESEVIELPEIDGGYYVTYQRCCRGEALTNIYNSEREGSNFYTWIPGLGSRPENNSAFFDIEEAPVICAGLPLRYNYRATDPDGDSLTYSLCNALTGGSTRANETAASPPPYNSYVSYIPPYTGANPMGGNPQLSIDNNGLITGTPNRSGKFVVSVCVSEWDRRTKRLLGTHQKDILITVYNCATRITASTPSTLYHCNDSLGMRVPITNNSVAGYTSRFLWYFSDGTDTITDSRNIFFKTFADTGVYTVKLVVNPGLPCTDSTTGRIFNYPGLRTGFTVQGVCRENPVFFTDTSTYRNGVITRRQWDFGVPGTDNDTSSLTAPLYRYANGDVYTIRLHIQTNRGCDATVTKNFRLYEVRPFAGNDTILARGQPLRLNGQGGEIYRWSPGTGLDNPDVADPMLNWNEEITFRLRVSNPQGCVGFDDINVKYYTGPEFYIPNAFSPNGDGNNDFFRFIPVGIKEYYYFRIFNRWGELVYNSLEFRKGWDGTYKGKPAAIDTYLWILEGLDLNGVKISKKGTVTLLR
ncbi:gliding motility-associated C-terminal domain-containing protein [Chitinophaga caseinilytica]|uniref:Gliding motility-associated C-terminal domain-containing protein n=1 Tax=Chitinophaga caseinilytica TaxID=2267521 RepID=A0ABZ2Z4C5_9BACT